jgi:hypothetical protein
MKAWNALRRDHADVDYHRGNGCHRLLHLQEQTGFAGESRNVMSQSSAIAGALFLSFLIFITMKGELPKYVGFVF